MTRSSFDTYESKYCFLCDKHFYSKALLHQHIQGSSRHPRCDECKHSFLNTIALRHHQVYYEKHHYCRLCEKHFASAAASGPPMESTFVNSDDSGVSDAEDGRLSGGWHNKSVRQHNAPNQANQSGGVLGIDEADELVQARTPRHTEITDSVTRRLRANSAAAHAHIHAIQTTVPLFAAHHASYAL